MRLFLYKRFHPRSKLYAFFVTVALLVGGFTGSFSSVKAGETETIGAGILMKIRELQVADGNYERIKINTQVNSLVGASFDQEFISKELGATREFASIEGQPKHIGRLLSIPPEVYLKADSLEIDFQIKYEKGFFSFPTVYRLKDSIPLAMLRYSQPTTRTYRISSEGNHRPTVLVVEYRRTR